MSVRSNAARSGRRVVVSRAAAGGGEGFGPELEALLRALRARPVPPSLGEIRAALAPWCRRRSWTAEQHAAVLAVLAACGWTRERMLAPYAKATVRRSFRRGAKATAGGSAARKPEGFRGVAGEGDAPSGPPIWPSHPSTPA